MAAKNFILASEAEKELSKLPSKIQNKILTAFSRIKSFIKYKTSWGIRKILQIQGWRL